MRIFSSLHSCMSRASCILCQNAQVGPDYYGWGTRSLLGCKGFGENKKAKNTPENNPLYVVQVGTEKGQATQDHLPRAATINTNGKCSQHRPVSWRGIIERSFGRPLPH